MLTKEQLQKELENVFTEFFGDVLREAAEILGEEDEPEKTEAEKTIERIQREIDEFNRKNFSAQSLEKEYERSVAEAKKREAEFEEKCRKSREEFEEKCRKSHEEFEARVKKMREDANKEHEARVKKMREEHEKWCKDHGLNF